MPIRKLGSGQEVSGSGDARSGDTDRTTTQRRGASDNQRDGLQNWDSHNECMVAELSGPYEDGNAASVWRTAEDVVQKSPAIVVVAHSDKAHRCSAFYVEDVLCSDNRERAYDRGERGTIRDVWLRCILGNNRSCEWAGWFDIGNTVAVSAFLQL